MNIQGITSNNREPIQVLQIQPGKLEEAKQAAQKNQLDEFIVENDQGAFVVFGKDLSLDFEYARQDGVTIRTLPNGFIGAPEVGEQIQLGDLKGKLVFFNDQTDRRVIASRVGIAVGGVAGLMLGGGRGAAAGINVALSAFTLAMVGNGVGYGLTHLLAKPKFDTSSLTRLCLPSEQTKAAVTDSPKI